MVVKEIVKKLTMILPDSLYIRLKYFQHFKKFPNLRNPKTFNEKLQWLKLHDRNPEYTKMVDKYEVRKYIAEKIGEEYLIPLIGVWDSADDVDFDSLPNQFVLKCNHNSGTGMVICKDKSSLDIDETREKLRQGLKEKYFYSGREWPYKNVKPRIIAEQYMSNDGNIDAELTDYKFSCFNGRVDNVMLCLERSTGDVKFRYFDKKWKLLRYDMQGKALPKGYTIPKPEKMDEMFELAGKLSEGIRYLRVDLYCSENKIYFGELTFFPQSGFDIDILKETDELFGSYLDLDR